MKRVLIGLIIVLLTLILASVAIADDQIAVVIDGKNLVMDQAPVIQEGRTLVPMRAIFEALNCNVEWISETKTVLAAKTGFDLSLTINQAEMLVNGKTYPLDVPGQIINERIMVPVRAISEALDAVVVWDANNKTIAIFTFDITIDHDGIISVI